MHGPPSSTTVYMYTLIKIPLATYATPIHLNRGDHEMRARSWINNTENGDQHLLACDH
jgi:hypothetical protein